MDKVVCETPRSAVECSDREHDGDACVEVLVDGVLEETHRLRLCQQAAAAGRGTSAGRRPRSQVADAGARRQRFPQLVDVTRVHGAERGCRASP